MATWPYYVEPFDYNKPNEYNRWADLSIKYDQLINPYFPHPSPPHFPYMYTFFVHDTGGLRYLYNGQMWCYNNYNTFIIDIKHKLGCSLMHRLDIPFDAVRKFLQEYQFPTTFSGLTGTFINFVGIIGNKNISISISVSSA